MKKINFKSRYNKFKSQYNNLKSQYNNTIAIFTVSALFFLYLLYLSIPSLYNTGRVQKDLADKLARDFNLNISLSTDISYRILPQPHFLFKDSKLFEVKSNINNEIGEFKELKIFISQKNFFNKNDLSIKKILISKANFFIKRSNFKFIVDFFNKKFPKKKIEIRKSKIFFHDKNKNIVFIYTIDKSDFLYIESENSNIYNTSGKIYQIPIKFKWSKNFDDKSKITKLKTRKIPIDFYNKGYIKNNKYYYDNVINIFSSKFKTNYEFNKKSIILNSKKSLIKNTPINYKGIINTDPFNFKLDINSKEFDLSQFLKNTHFLNDIIFSKVIFNQNINGSISIKSNKILKNKIFDKINLLISFEEGKINLDNSVLFSNKIGFLELYNSDITEEEGKILFNSKIKFNIKDLNSFYKIFLIPKNKRKKISKIDFDISYDVVNGNTKISRIFFYGVRNEKINSELVEKVVENNMTDNYNYSNFILFKNFFKKVLAAYYEEG